MTGNREQTDPYPAEQGDESDPNVTLPAEFDEAAFFRRLVDGASDGIIAIDENGTIVFANAAIEAVLGYPPSDFVGESLDAFVVDTHRAKIPAVDARWSEASTDRLDIRAMHADGDEVRVGIDVQRLTLEGRRLLAGYVRERPPHETSERPIDHYEAIAELAGDAYYQLNSDGYFEMVSDSIAEITGYSRDELLGKHVSMVLDEETVDQGTTAIKDLLATENERVGTVEFEFKSPEGTTIPCEVEMAVLESDGVLQGTVGVARDISKRKKRVKELRQERGLIEHVLETSPVGIGVISPDGDISRVNDRAEELFGLTDYELTNRTFDVTQRQLYDSAGNQISPEDLLARVFDDGDRVLDTEFELGQPDGSRSWLSISIAPIEGQTGGIEKAVIIGKDVTDRKRREETLREERDVIEHILETSPVGIGVISPDGDISRVNDRAEDLLGLTIEEITNQTLDVSQRRFYSAGGKRVPPEDLLSRVFDDGEQVLNSEFTLERPDGDRVWVAISIAPIEGQRGTVEKAVVIATDISDRKERERRMRESEARLRQIAENINSAIWMADADMSEILYINPAYEAITGRSRDSVYDSLLNHLDAVHPQDEQRVANAMKQPPRASRNDAGVRQFQEKYRIVRPDGSTRWVNSFAFPLQNDEGDVYRFVGVIDDITEVKEQQLELGRQRDELETLNQINTVIRQVNQGLVQATTRDDIETQVCETLTDSKLYHAAWIGDVAAGLQRVEPKTGTGLGADTLDTSFDVREIPPIAMTVESGDVQIIRDFDTLPSDIALDNPDDQSGIVSRWPFAAVIPLVYKDMVYDVLVVYSSRANAFGVREQAVLQELGKTIGLAINAVERKKALLTDAVVEIEFEIADPDLFFVAASDDLGATFEMEGVVSQSDGSYLQYFTVTDAAADTVLERAQADDSIDRARIVNDHGDTALVEFLISGASPATILAEYGATVHSATFADGWGRVEAAVSQRADVRVAVEAVRSTFARSELVGKRERERPVRTNREFRIALDEALTERQSATLETAYYAGFFEWPRDSSGEDIAESLRVAPATFHQHVRAGEKKLVEILVDDDDIG